MNTKLEQHLKFDPTIQGYNSTIKDNVIAKIEKRERFQFFYKHVLGAVLITSIIFFALLYSDTIIYSLNNITASFLKTNSASTISNLDDVPIFPGLVKDSERHAIYSIDGTSILKIKEFYDEQLENNNWWKVRDDAEAVENDVVINSIWSNEHDLMEITYVGKENNKSVVEFQYYNR